MRELEHILIARVTQPVDLRKLLNLAKANRYDLFRLPVFAAERVH